MQDREHRLILKLGAPEEICLQIREKLFDGSWSKFLKHIKEKGSAEQKRDDIPIIKKLMQYEERYGVNLLDEDWEIDNIEGGKQ